MRHFVCLGLTLLAACATDPDLDPGDDSPDAAPGDPGPDAPPGTPGEQLPPTGDAAALEAWLAAGHYTAWACEPAPHPARPPGAHGMNRICSNDALAGAGPSGAFPAGAASVKEIHDASGIRGWAVGVKLQADSAGGDGWYWYERIGTTVYANGTGVGLCTGCHEDARDYVFTQVTP